jgi:hypothetical protein
LVNIRTEIGKIGIMWHIGNQPDKLPNPRACASAGLLSWPENNGKSKSITKGREGVSAARAQWGYFHKQLSRSVLRSPTAELATDRPQRWRAHCTYGVIVSKGGQRD